MDFENLKADVDRILSTHFTKGRSGRTLQFTVLHYNAGDLSVEDCYNTWQSREASAQYQVQSDGIIGQLVWDADTAWHAGNWDANCKSIGIEYANQGDSITDACLESGAHLLAAIHKFYGLGRPEWGVNVFPHCHFSATSCPGPLKEGTSYHNRYMARAQQWYDAMVDGTDPGDAPTGEQTQPSGEHAGQGFGGTYRCTVDWLRVRDAPGVGGNEVTHYDAGGTVVLDDWYKIADGYVWGRYTSYSGHTRYIAVGKATGKPEADDFLVKA